MLSKSDPLSGASSLNTPVYLRIPSVRTVAWTLSLCIAFLHSVNLARVLIHSQTGHGNVWGLMPLFNVDLEGNIPTFYSVITLLVAGGLAAIVAILEREKSRPFWKHWTGIAVAFAWVAFDEGCRIHELTIPIGQVFSRTGVFYFAWVIPAMAILAVLGLVYMRMIFSLPGWLRNRAILAAVVFLSGALGMEMVGGVIAEKSGLSLAYHVACGTEELLEMAGVAIWICALLRHLSARRPPLTVALTFPGPR
jgi:hypothetical protein